MARSPRVFAVGGDRYSGSTFIDRFLCYEAHSEFKMLVLLGLLVVSEDYHVIEVIGTGRIKVPIEAWAIGTSCSAESLGA